MNLIFNQINIKDKAIVLKLFKEAAEKIAQKNINHWQYWHNPPQDKIQWVEDGIQNGEYFFINDENHENIGMVRILDSDILYWGEQNEKAKYVHSLVVRDCYNGRGIGENILEKIVHDARSENCKYLRLDADFKNLKLCAFYEKMGFEKVGIKKLKLSSYNLYQKALKT